MKQHITVEQLFELDKYSIYKLIVYNLNLFMTSDPDYKWYSEQITIGKMIEILCDSEFCFPSIGLTESSKVSELIVVGVTCLSGSKKYRGKTIEGNELCDALWNTVKLILSDIKIHNNKLTWDEN